MKRKPILAVRLHAVSMVLSISIVSWSARFRTNLSVFFANFFLHFIYGWSFYEMCCCCSFCLILNTSHVQPSTVFVVFILLRHPLFIFIFVNGFVFVCVCVIRWFTSHIHNANAVWNEYMTHGEWGHYHLHHRADDGFAKQDETWKPERKNKTFGRKWNDRH